jgi:hypothetical protein
MLRSFQKVPIVSLQGVPTPYGGFSILVSPNEVKLKETSAGGCNDLGL